MKVGRREQIKRSLRSLRATVGLSQLAVAERIGVTEKHYWRIENGYDTPTDTERGALARVLKVDDTMLPWAALAIEAKAS